MAAPTVSVCEVAPASWSLRVSDLEQAGTNAARGVMMLDTELVRLVQLREDGRTDGLGLRGGPRELVAQGFRSRTGRHQCCTWRDDAGHRAGTAGSAARGWPHRRSRSARWPQRAGRSGFPISNRQAPMLHVA